MTGVHGYDMEFVGREREWHVDQFQERDLAPTRQNPRGIIVWEVERTLQWK